MKKASDYVIGERFREANYDDGIIVALSSDSARPDRAYILVVSDDACYTIYTCLKDAISQAALPRRIPAAVLRDFLFQVFFDGTEPQTLTEISTREPIARPEPRHRPPRQDEDHGENNVEVTPEDADLTSENISGDAVPISGDAEEEATSPEPMLPEIDFP